jgi:hypothetical protein
LEVLSHRFCETTLVASFDYPDYRNDFAVWASKHLGDKVLAERLGTVDPYCRRSLEELRVEVLNVIGMARQTSSSRCSRPSTCTRKSSFHLYWLV